MERQTSRIRYSVSVDVDIMRSEGNMSDDEIKEWFNTPSEIEDEPNGYLEDVADGIITLEELNSIIEEELAK